MDKVLEALYNCIRTPKCLDCPWESCEELDIEKVEIPRNLACDVYAMLKAQEPKVMTLEEVNNLDWDYCYLEKERIPGEEYRFICGKHILTCVTWPSITAAKISFGCDEYGKTWRCWTARPTDEQRKAVKWDG